MSYLDLTKDDYKKKKLQSQEFEKLITGRVGFSRSLEIQDCARILDFITDKEFEKHKVWRLFTCKHPFCPTCIWRKARKDGMKISVIMDWIEKQHNKEFIFLTLTVPRVRGHELSDTIDLLQTSYQKMIQRKEVKSVIKGYARKLEVTYDNNKKITKKMYKRKKDYYDKRGLMVGFDNPQYDTYHPHFHVIIAVNKSYFTDTKLYIKQSRWLELWKKATGIENITQVDVRKVKKNKGKEVQEIAKYSAKSSDYLVNQDVFDIFRMSLHRRRRLVYSGLFKDGAKLYDSGELDHYLPTDETEYEYLVKYAWNNHNDYNQTEVRMLTDEEKAEINGEKIKEIEVD